MILILTEPTEKDLEIIKKIMGDKSIETFDLVPKNENKKTEVKNNNDWLSPEEFTTAVKKKGYSCKRSHTRKSICDTWGIDYELRGKTLFFRNQIEKIPSRLKQAS